MSARELSQVPTLAAEWSVHSEGTVHLFKVKSATSATLSASTTGLMRLQ